MHQVTEYFSAISGHDDEASAVQVAVERAAEAFDAECVAVVRDGRVLGQVGLRAGAALPPALVARGATTVELPGVGLCHRVCTQHPNGGADEVLVVARLAGAFDAEERQLLQGMAQVLALALRGLRVLATERELRANREREAEERLRLLGVVRTRERLLERLLQIQRAISRRQPLAAVLEEITAGAVGLLDREVVVAVAHRARSAAGELLLAAPTGPLEPAGAAASLRAAADALRTGAPATAHVGGAHVLALPVHVGDVAEAGLVARTSCSPLTAAEQDLLEAFAQQVASALADARTLQQVQEAQHDDLTGLPSRALFLSQLSEALDARITEPRLTLLFIDLDRFKQVNDSLGHAAGDELLVAVAGRLRQCLRGSDLAARLGGDEFAVLLAGLSPTAGLGVAQRITSALRSPFQVAGREVFISSSIGIVEPGCDQRDAAALLSSADVAMYRCKKAGDGQPVLFDVSMHRHDLDQLDLQGDLQRALDLDQLHLVYQPLVRLADGRVTGVEALLRWDHPTRGPVPPCTFIPLAEQTGVVVDLGRWVLQQATAQLAHWRREFPELTLNVNVSGRQLAEPDFAWHVQEALARAGLCPGALTLELTETVLVGDPEHAPERLSRLRELGVHLAVDDFGTGYSSLSYLRRLPVDQLKIDKAFVAGLGRDVQDLAIARTIVDLARTLGMQTVAEGIEDDLQQAALTALGCDSGQGFHLARPMPARDLHPYLRAHAARPSCRTPEPAPLRG